MHILEHLFEGRAAYYLQLVIREVVMCRNIMKATDFTLYCNSFHIFLFRLCCVTLLLLLEKAQSFFYCLIILIEILHPCLFIKNVIDDS